MGRVGMLFQQTRTEMGFTLGEVADALNIDVRYIFDLEDEAYDDLPGKTYAIGYAKSYAKFLGLNPKRIASEIAVEIGYEEALPAEREDVRDPNRRREMENFTKRSRKNRRNMLGIFVVLLILLVLSFLGTRLWI